MNFEKISLNIYHLKVPFADNFTSVFAIVDEGDVIVMDSGDSGADVEHYVLPALRELGLTPTVLTVSHAHRDHAGGLPALISAFPKAKVKLGDPLAHKDLGCKVQTLADKKAVTKHVKAVHLPGHSDDMFGLWDTREGILLTGDGLQQWGISRWGTIVKDRKAYMRTLDKVEDMKIERIIASHDYEPLGMEAEGREEIIELLCECRETMYDIEDFVFESGCTDIEELQRGYGARYPERPPLFKTTIKNMLK